MVERRFKSVIDFLSQAWVNDEAHWNNVDINTLEVAVGEPLLHTIIKMTNDADLVCELLDCGADVNVQDQHGNSPLHVSCRQHRHEDIAEVLLDHGADPNATDRYMRTPLHLFFSSDMSKDLLRALLSMGADPNAIDRSGKTPLRYAQLYNASSDLVLLLLKHGAIVNIGSKLGTFHWVIGDVQIKSVDKKLIKMSLVSPDLYEKYSDDYRIPINKVESKFRLSKELEHYKNSCLSEITRMQNDILPGGISMWTFVIKNKLVTTIPYSKGIFTEVFNRMKRYSIYCDVIRKIINSCTEQLWFNALLQQNVWPVNSVLEPIVLNEDCLREIAQFLSLRDLFHLTVAFGGEIKGKIRKRKRKSMKMKWSRQKKRKIR